MKAAAPMKPRSTAGLARMHYKFVPICITNSEGDIPVTTSHVYRQTALCGSIKFYGYCTSIGILSASANNK